MKNIFITLVILFLSGAVFAQISEASIRRHIRVLANDSIMGRGTGSSGERMAAAYIESEFRKIKLLPKGDDKTYFQSFPFKGGAHGTGASGIGRNILGFIDNHAAYTVVIGAHYDHVGLGYDGNSLDANPQDKIHNGADDNASGTAGVIELARYFQNNNVREKYNFLFLCFSGEELGLYGSKYFTEHFTVDADKIDYMINMDMIGRLDPVSKSLIINGTGTSPVWETIIKSLSTNGIKIKTDSSGMGPSDQTSFYLKNIPAIHFFTGSHGDYHKPSDDWDKINYAGAAAVLDLIIEVVNNLDAQPKIAFLQTKNKSTGGRSAFKVTMGIMPSYTADVTGLKVDGVTDGKPAQKGGIKTGDIITKMGEYPVKDIQDYMTALGKFEKGQTVQIEVKRNDETIMLPITF